MYLISPSFPSPETLQERKNFPVSTRLLQVDFWDEVKFKICLRLGKPSSFQGSLLIIGLWLLSKLFFDTAKVPVLPDFLGEAEAYPAWSWPTACCNHNFKNGKSKSQMGNFNIFTLTSYRYRVNSVHLKVSWVDSMAKNSSTYPQPGILHANSDKLRDLIRKRVTYPNSRVPMRSC